MNPKVSILVAAASFAVWVVLAFGIQMQSGWVHIPLAVTVGMIARAIVVGDERGAV